MNSWKRFLLVIAVILVGYALIHYGGLKPSPTPLGKEHVGSEVDVGLEPFVGIGVAIDYGVTPPVIRRVYPGSPAQEVGLFAGDELLTVDGQSTEGRTADEVQGWLKGDGRSPSWMKITVSRFGWSEPLGITVPRRTLSFRAHEVEGVGITFDERFDYDRYFNLRVEDVMPASPAGKAGLRAGDIVTAIDGRDTGAMTLSSAGRRIRGKPGTAVELRILRGIPDIVREPSAEGAGQTETLTVNVTRERFWYSTVAVVDSDTDK